MSGKAGYIQKKTNENSFFTATLKTLKTMKICNSEESV